MGMDDAYKMINQTLVSLINEIWELEEKAIITDEFKDLTNNDMHVRAAVGLGEGNNMSSIDLANKLDKIFITNPNITFIIGGSDGLHQEIKNLSNYSLSFSKMTFPHGLFRLILLEQIYRSFKILNNESYHK